MIISRATVGDGMNVKYGDTCKYDFIKFFILMATIGLLIPNNAKIMLFHTFV